MHAQGCVSPARQTAAAKKGAAKTASKKGQHASRGKQTHRIERDPLGEVRLPNDVLYGAQTHRARESFKISRLRIHPELITAYAEIKQAAAWANLRIGAPEPDVAEAIIRAATELAGGKWRDQFDLDVFQAGAGTSYNMNVNEVLANRALEILGDRRGNQERLDANDHVNKGQSTNDTMPTAMRIASLRLLRELLGALDGLVDAFEKQAKRYAGLEKSGRTHLHDAVPMGVGEELNGYAATVRRAALRLRQQEPMLLEVPLGGTAVGTATNAKPGYAALAVQRLAEITGLDLKEAPDRVSSQHSLGDFVALSGALRGLAVELGKIASDLRLLNSGPHTGLNEVELPAMQPGSSIMPGKVNPAVAEMLGMVCFHVIGHDAAITHCAEHGQLELNVFMPYVAYALFESLDVMREAVRTFDKQCVGILRWREDKAKEYAERTVGRAALLNEELGFMGAAEVAERAAATGKSVPEVMKQK